MTSSAPLSVAYILQMFPSMTETFIYREIAAVRQQGLHIQPYAIFRPPLSQLSEEARAFVAETFYTLPLSWWTLLLAHLWYLCRRPWRYLTTLGFVLTRPGESWHDRRRTLGHFVHGMVMVRQIERQRPAHIHAHFGWSASTIALIAHRLLDIPFSVTFHSFHSEKAYPPHLLAKDKMRLARFVVAISEYHRQFMRSLFPGDPTADKIHVIHHGLDPAAFTPAPASPHPATEFLIGAVGQLIPCKGFAVLLEACRRLAAQGVPFRCCIYGEGPDRARLERLVTEYDLQAQVTLPGWIDQHALRQWLNQVDVFALPCLQDETGRQDGLPVVLTEAMAMERPVISTPIGGIPELIAPEQNGLLVPPADAAALATALARLHADASLGRRLGPAARQTVLTEFNIHRSAERLAALFQGQ